MENADGEVPLLVVRIFGGILFLCGLGIAGTFVFLASGATANGRLFTAEIMAVLGAFAVIATFCTLVGARMLFNQPTSRRSVLSPAGWIVLGGVVAIFGLVCGVLVMRASPQLALTGIAACGVFVVWCAKAARRLRRRAKGDL